MLEEEIGGRRVALLFGGAHQREPGGVLGVQQNGAGFGEKDFSGFRQPQGFGAAFKQLKTDFVFEIADLPAQARLRDVQLQRGTRNILLLGDGDEITEVAQFHSY